MKANDTENGDGLVKELERVLSASADLIDSTGFNADDVRQVSRTRHRRHRLVLVAAALVAVAAVGATVVTTSGGGREQVRAGDPIATAPAEISCLRPGADHTVGYVHLRGEQAIALIETDPDGPGDGSLLFGEEPALLTAAQYEVLRDSDQAITVAQLAQMGYGLAPSGPATTAPTTTTAPLPTSTLPEGVTAFEAWADALRDRGLLTSEQEADIAAGRGISLTAEQGQVINEVFPTPASTPNGPVAEKAGFTSEGEAGPPICPAN